MTPVDTDAGVEALLPHWEALWRTTPGATPFQSPRWLLPWWRVWGNGRPLVACRWEGGRLTGVLPCYVFAGAAGDRLLPMGAGVTDYLDALGAAPGALVSGLLRAAAGAGIGRCDLSDVVPGSALPDVDPGPGWRADWTRGSACPVLPLAPGGGWLPHKMRRNLALARNRAARLGPVTLEHATADGLDEALDRLAALHQGRWTGKGEAGVMADPLVVRFHREAAPGLLAAGLLRLSLLRVGGEVAAACLALLDRGRIHFHLSGFDVTRRAISPGVLLFGALLEEATGEGRSEAHFLRGAEGYKYGWGARDRFNATGSFTVVAGGAGR